MYLPVLTDPKDLRQIALGMDWTKISESAKEYTGTDFIVLNCAEEMEKENLRRGRRFAIWSIPR